MELCQSALLPHPAWDSLMLGSTTAQPPASAGTVILDTDPNRTATRNCGCALPDILSSAWAFSWDGGDGVSLGGMGWHYLMSLLMT